MVTRRCTQRQFLLRPDAATNNAFVYCLAVAAQRHEMSVSLFIAMSNHLHDAIYDPHGNTPAFNADFHRLLAKCMNAMRGRWENFFADEQPSVVQLMTREDFIEKLVYIATNPVKDGLVARVRDWPGASGYHALMTNEPVRATRPTHYFAKDGDMPEAVELRLEIPKHFGDRETLLAEVRERVAKFEQDAAKKRAETRTPVLGRKRVLAQSWQDSPMSLALRRGLRPTFAGRSFWTRLEAIQRKRAFYDAYQEARRMLIERSPIPFPYGTYALRRNIGVEVEPAEKFN